MASSESSGKSELKRAADALTQEAAFGRIVGKSPEILSVIRDARRYASRDSAVLLLAESGSGKELVARGIHYASRRSAGPFIAENCSAVPSDLFEDCFFGNVA